MASIRREHKIPGRLARQSASGAEATDMIGQDPDYLSYVNTEAWWLAYNQGHEDWRSAAALGVLVVPETLERTFHST
jgi:hypothetical protein